MKILEVLLKYEIYIWIGILFFAIWYQYDDALFAFHATLFIMGMNIFNRNIISTYRAFKSNGFNYRRAKEELNWPYICISTPLVVVLFLIFFYGTNFLFLAWFVSAGLLAMLFVYDLIVNGFK